MNELSSYILSEKKDHLSATLGKKATQIASIRNEIPAINDEPSAPSSLERISYKRRQYLRAGSIGVKEELTEASTQERKRNGDSLQAEAIAIIGMSGRFAKSNSVDELWKHLAQASDLVEEVSRWDLSQHYPSSPDENNYCNHGSFIENFDHFDPLFFNISGLEATYMDPQQRLFLEESWKALEDAGYAGRGIEGRRFGVYAGYNGGGYRELFSEDVPAQSMWGNAGSVIPARIAYYLNLKGPAVTLDTACSSSLVAIHFACQALGSKEIEMALAGAVFIHSTPTFYLDANRAGMLSSTGRCHTFDQRADGFVPGEGVGVIVLKRLQEAIAGGDHIYGVIEDPERIRRHIQWHHLPSDFLKNA